MLNIMLSGCCGSMGRAVTAFADNRNDIKITAGIDREGRECKFPTFVSPFSFNGKVDVIIDFSSPAALPGLLEYAVSAKTPTVIATTGLNEAHTALIYKAAKEIPIFFSANMSLGINLLCELAKTAARVLGGTYDIEIVETHLDEIGHLHDFFDLAEAHARGRSFFDGLNIQHRPIHSVLFSSVSCYHHQLTEADIPFFGAIHFCQLTARASSFEER